jgi:LDH2 family malate/lactate/ureidoglycolate dehydrogenase
MAQYPATGREKRCRFEDVRARVQSIFEGVGMRPADAALLADTLAVADLRGVHSHGVLRVPEYVAKLRDGGVDPRGTPRVVSALEAALVIDGGNSMGQIAADFAMRAAIERARTQNVAVAAVRGSNHCGAMAYFAMYALSQGMIGLAMTNALPTMAPWGGVDKIVGINPLAAAVPAAKEHPFVFDAAFSHSSHGKIRVYQQKGAAIPPHWAFDRQGRPTTNATEALEGLLQPIGEYKGVGLAMLSGLLSSLLSGAAYGTQLGDMKAGPKAGRDGHCFVAIRIGAFVDLAEFRQRMDTVIRQVRDSRPASGVEEVWAPGGLEAHLEQQYRRDGIPLNEETLRALDALDAAGPR